MMRDNNAYRGACGLFFSLFLGSGLLFRRARANDNESLDAT